MTKTVTTMSDFDPEIKWTQLGDDNNDTLAIVQYKGYEVSIVTGASGSVTDPLVPEVIEIPEANRLVVVLDGDYLKEMIEASRDLDGFADSMEAAGIPAAALFIVASITMATTIATNYIENLSST